jgi:hypothetical protein
MTILAVVEGVGVETETTTAALAIIHNRRVIAIIAVTGNIINNNKIY